MLLEQRSAIHFENGSSIYSAVNVYGVKCIILFVKNFEIQLSHLFLCVLPNSIPREKNVVYMQCITYLSSK